MCLAIPGRLTSIEGTDPLLRSGKVEFGGVTKQVNLTFVPHAVVGDYVLIHVGFAISTIDEVEARQVFEYLRQLDRLVERDPALDDPGSGELA